MSVASITELMADHGQLAEAAAALIAERDALKRRGDNHAETLRGIARMDPATEGARMAQWARDGLSGYTASAGDTLKESIDRANALVAERGALRKALEECAWDHDLKRIPDRPVEVAFNNCLGFFNVQVCQIRRRWSGVRDESPLIVGYFREGSELDLANGTGWLAYAWRDIPTPPPLEPARAALSPDASQREAKS